jgi:phosphomannomutase
LQFCKSENELTMTLIKSISGIRGTIGGKAGDSLSPLDIVKFTAAFGTWIIRRQGGGGIRIIVGRDGRTSGKMVNCIVTATLQSIGINVTDLGLASTPTVEIAVTGSGSSGGIIITASHNPANWNALKLLNEKGEFLSSDEGNEVLQIASSEEFKFVPFDLTGTIISDTSWGEKHIEQVLDLRLVDTEAIRSAGLNVVLDCINSVGGIILPALLKRLGVNKITLLNQEPDGHFAHNPEPLPENLKDISETVVREKADVGFAVDPDVDRLAIICEDGTMFGEEYTLVAVADYVLSSASGNSVSNMSSTTALKDVTQKHGGLYFSSEVGEVNVVREMKIHDAVIGGEGNGGIIYPEFHYGRDALVGIALFLSSLAKSKLKCSVLRKSFPRYFIAKKKISLDLSVDMTKVFDRIKKNFHEHEIDERDGLRIEFSPGWAHIRRSNTEPVIRIYTEGVSENDAERIADNIIMIVKNL